MTKPLNIETLLHEQPLVAPVRDHLTAATLKLAVEAKQARRTRRQIAVLFCLVTLLLLAKWVRNDLLYLIQLPLTHLQTLRGQTSLYLQAVWESLPHLPLLAAIVMGLLWLVWRRIETLLTTNRKTGVIQGHAMKLIKLTPRLAILSAILGVTTLGASGYAVAQQVQQHKLEVLRQRINSSGRTELQTKCSTESNPNLVNEYEIKRGSGISASDAAKIIEATCLQTAANDTLSRALGAPVNSGGAGGTMTASTMFSQVAQVADRHGNSLTLLMPAATSGADPSSQTASLASDVKVFKDDASTALSSLEKGELIITVGRAEVTGLVILPRDPELKWYGPAYSILLTQLTPCEGNPMDSCSFTGSIDFYPSGGGEGNTINSAFNQPTSVPMKEIAGVITEITPTYTKIKTSSSRIFQISFGSNPAADFNRSRMQNYGNDPATVGDKILVRYAEPTDQHATTISQNRIFNAALMIEFAGKDKPIKQY